MNSRPKHFDEADGRIFVPDHVRDIFAHWAESKAVPRAGNKAQSAKDHSFTVHVMHVGKRLMRLAAGPYS